MKLEFHHINYVAQDVDRLHDFYTNILGLAEDCLNMYEARPVMYSAVAQAFKFDTRQVPSMLDEAHPALLRMIDEARLDCRNHDEGVLTVPESATVFMDINDDDAPEISFDFG